MRLITRPALTRIALLFVILILIVSWCWWSMVRMPLKSFRGPLPALTAAQIALRDELRGHVTKLTAEIGERNAGYRPRSLDAAADYVQSRLVKSGLEVERQTFEAAGEHCHNLVAEVRGRNQPEEIVVVGAHYDSVVGSPGADDNASGVAALLALARREELKQPARTLRYVAFANEEPPYFQTAQMGSLVYARRCRERDENVVAMLSLESLGYYDPREGSQKYPLPLALFYPSRADFVAFVGRSSDRALVRRCVMLFRESAQFPSEGGALPGALPGIGWSDHWAFWQAGYPALMATDTAPFRSPHYHATEDTPDKLDYERFARVVDGLGKVIANLVAH